MLESFKISKSGMRRQKNLLHNHRSAFPSPGDKMSNATDPKTIFIEESKVRFYKALGYLTLFAYVIFVSACAFFADYILTLLIGYIAANDISKYPAVSLAFDWFKIGSAFLAFIVFGVHSFFSAWSQIKFEIETIKEPNLSKGKNHE